MKIIAEETRLMRKSLDQSLERLLSIQMRSPDKKKTPKNFATGRRGKLNGSCNRIFFFLLFITFFLPSHYVSFLFEPTDRSTEREDIFQFLFSFFCINNPDIDSLRCCESFLLLIPWFEEKFERSHVSETLHFQFETSLRREKKKL